MPDTCANPLFLGWVKEFVDTARDRNEKSASTYWKAHESLRVYPVRIDHPLEAQQLKGFGPKICKRLTEKLEEHCRENGLPMPEEPGKGTKKRSRAAHSENHEGEADAGATAAAAAAAAAPASATKKPRKARQYVPAYRSGAYALIIALSSLPRDSLQSLTKSELVELAQPHSESSFTAPSDPTKHYTAWNSMNTLVEKYLVHESGRPSRRYALTDEGWELADRMQSVSRGSKGKTKASGLNAEDSMEMQQKDLATSGDFIDLEDVSEEEEQPRSNAIPAKENHVRAQQAGTMHGGPSNIIELSPSPEPLRPTRPALSTTARPKSSSMARTELQQNETRRSATPLQALPTFDPIEIPAGSFEVRLVLDNREVLAKSKRSYIQAELEKKDVIPLTRSLELGDFFWVAKLTDPVLRARLEAEGDELALDWIVERKRLDDLVSSITDGRFQEQKFRLAKSGAKNVVYLIETFNLQGDSQTRFQEAIRSSIASTQVVNGYFMKQTQKMDETIRYITRLTFMLKSLYEPKTLHLIPKRVLTQQNHLPLLKHLRQDTSRSYHIPYASFASLSSKSDALSLRDVFLKMLMCTRGISGEKALVIQKHWDTPRALVEAFERCSSPKERERLVEEKLGNQVGRNRVKGVLSAKVAEIWGEG